MSASPCFSEVTLTAKGKVQDPSGNPIAHARVYVLTVNRWETPPTSLVGSNQTDDNGNFIVEAHLPRPGVCFLVAYQYGLWLGWSMERISFRSDKTGKLIEEPALLEQNVTVSKLVTATGRVEDESHRPIAGAEVRVWSFSDKNPPPREMGINISAEGMAEMLTPVVTFDAATTDSKGNYRLTRVPEMMDTRVLVLKEGYAVKTPGSVGSFAFSKTSILVPAGQITGRLVDQHGQGVAKVRIMAVSFGNDPAALRTITAQDGTFLFNRLTPSSYNLNFGDKAASRDVLVEAHKVTKLGDILPPKLVSISGRIVDADSSLPLAGVPIQGLHIASTKTDSYGRYTLSVSPGEIFISYGSTEPLYAWDHHSEQIVVPGTGLKDLTFKLKKADVAKGLVKGIDGNPLRGAIIRAGEASAMSSEKGRFDLPLPVREQDRMANEIIVAAEDPQHSSGVIAAVNRHEFLSKGIALTLHPAKSLKVVVKNIDGKPLADAQVNIGIQEVSNINRYGRTDSRGEIVLNGVYEGRLYDTYASLSGYRSSRDHFVVGGVGWKPILEVTMTHNDVARGKVVDEAGRGIENASITLSFDRQHMIARSHSDGSFEFNIPAEDLAIGKSRPLVGGLISLIAVSDDSSLGSTVMARRQELITGITFTLRPTRTATVIVTDTKGNRLKGAQVGCDWPTGAITDAKGIAILNNLVWGSTCVVNAKMPGFFRPQYARGPTVGSAEWRDTVKVVMEPMKREQHGRVVDINGNPMPGVQVVTMMSVTENKTVITAPDGKFVIEGLPDALVPLRAQKGNLVGSVMVSSRTQDTVLRLCDMNTGCIQPETSQPTKAMPASPTGQKTVRMKKLIKIRDLPASKEKENSKGSGR